MASKAQPKNHIFVFNAVSGKYETACGSKYAAAYGTAPCVKCVREVRAIDRQKG